MLRFSKIKRYEKSFYCFVLRMLLFLFNIMAVILQIKIAHDENKVNDWCKAVEEAEEYLLLSGLDYKTLSNPEATTQIIAAGIKFYLEDRVKTHLQR